jgi:hypothetical protein
MIDISVDCALGARTVAVSTVLGDGSRLLFAGCLGTPFPPNFGVSIGY